MIKFRTWAVPSAQAISVPQGDPCETLDVDGEEACATGLQAAAKKVAVHDHGQRAVDALGYEPAGDELAGRTPTIFDHVNPLGTYDFSSDRPAGQLRPLRAATAA
ncbi:MAG TPA: hypothetical protein VFY45_12990 [Baekduia sp.]|nr:hypothetical protein [Baekduia sp.]